MRSLLIDFAILEKSILNFCSPDSDVPVSVGFIQLWKVFSWNMESLRRVFQITMDPIVILPVKFLLVLVKGCIVPSVT